MLIDVAILIHGYTLLTTDCRTDKEELGNRYWNYVVWGDYDKQFLGRVPMGVTLALEQKAKKLIFGTGASCINNETPVTRAEWETLGQPNDVKWEADFIYETLLERFRELEHFKVLERAINSFGGYSKAKKFIERISKRDNDSRNTQEEIRNALRECNGGSIQGLMSVTNASHAPRCLAIAAKEIRKNARKELFFIPVPCDTDFAESEDVLIFEPQSGPGPRRPLSPCTILQEYFGLSEEKKISFLASARKLLSRDSGEIR